MWRLGKTFSHIWMKKYILNKLSSIYIMADTPREWPGKNRDGNTLSEKAWDKAEVERVAIANMQKNYDVPYEPFKGIAERVRGPNSLTPSGNPQNPMNNKKYLEKVKMGATAERSAAKKADETLTAEIQNPKNYKRGGRRSKRYRKTKKSKSKRSSTKRKRSTKSKTKRSRK